MSQFARSAISSVRLAAAFRQYVASPLSLVRFSSAGPSAALASEQKKTKGAVAVNQLPPRPSPHEMGSNIARRLEEAKLRSSMGGGLGRVTSQHERNKLTARERIATLVDPGSFTEYDALVQHTCTDFGMEKQKVRSSVLYQ